MTRCRVENLSDRPQILHRHFFYINTEFETGGAGIWKKKINLGTPTGRIPWHSIISPVKNILTMQTKITSRSSNYRKMYEAEDDFVDEGEEGEEISNEIWQEVVIFAIKRFLKFLSFFFLILHIGLLDRDIVVFRGEGST